MGRAKEYQRDEVLEKAMRLFWLHGYDGVSTQILVDAMGINRKSVYAEFGTKKKLYHAALDHYLRLEIPQRFTALNADDAGLEAVFSTLDRFASAAGREGTEKGCLLCNAASETAYLDATVRGFVNDYFAQIKSAFGHALKLSVRNGELPGNFDTNKWSASLATVLIGMFVMIRSRTDGAMLRASADLAISQLNAQRTGG